MMGCPHHFYLWHFCAVHHDRIVMNLRGLPMKKKLLVITLGALLALSASGCSCSCSTAKQIKFIELTFSDYDFIGGGSYSDGYVHINLVKANATPSGQDLTTRYESSSAGYYFFSYVGGEDIDYGVGTLISLSMGETETEPNLVYHFEFAFPDDAEYLNVELKGEFYTNLEHTEKLTSRTYQVDKEADYTVCESVNEYYQITINTIVVSYR